MVTLPFEKNQPKDIGVAQSMLAGLGSGIFKIFEGAATLAATLMDLGVDKDRAEAVEAYFEKINPFDEAAEAKIQAAVDKAKDVSDEMMKEAHQAVADEKARANQNIEMERKKALAEVRNQVVDLTILSTSKLIKQSTKRETAEKLVDDVIKGVGTLS